MGDIKRLGVFRVCSSICESVLVHLGLPFKTIGKGPLSTPVFAMSEGS
jgi:hypothetical protein